MQKKEVVAGLKAGETYKQIILECEDKMETAKAVIAKQEVLLDVKDERIKEKDEVINLYQLEGNAKDHYIHDLEKELSKSHKKIGFWKGLTMAAVVTATLLAIR